MNDIKINASTAAPKSTKLERLEKRITQLQNQKRAIELRENEKMRKQRTRRLIQIGAIAIRYLNCPNDIEPQEFEKKIKDFIDDIEKNNQTK